jgi:hypothetical protein
MIDGKARTGARWPIVAAVVVVLLLAVAIVASRAGAPAAGQPAPTSQPRAQAQPAAHAPSPATTARTPAAVATAQVAAQGGSARTPAPTATARIAAPAAKPAASPAPAKPTLAVAPSGSVDVDRESIAREATWAPGQLQGHFEKHGAEGPWASESDFDASARDVIRIGTVFTYVDQTSHAERLGFYDRPSNRFVGVSRDGRRITTQFKPDRGEGYVRGLARSTYR